MSMQQVIEICPNKTNYLKKNLTGNINVSETSISLLKHYVC